MQGFFRIFYSTTYTVVFILLVLLLAVTPGDTIYQSINDSQLQNVFIVAGAYILVGVLVLFLYGSRIYTSRNALAAIPKNNIPTEAGDIGLKIQQLITQQLERSALIAWNSRPRDIHAETERERLSSERRPELKKGLKTNNKDDETFRLLRRTELLLNLSKPPWGTVEHSGWSSPSSQDFPDLQFSKVVDELANIIEAKAVSLAPPDSQLGLEISGNLTGQYAPDGRVFRLLQRSLSTDLRDYLAQLITYGIIKDEDTAVEFLAQYEHARYSSEELTESQFRDLMISFSSVLSGMVEINQQVIAHILDTSRALENDSNSCTSSSRSEESIKQYRTPNMAHCFGPSS